MIDPSIYCLVLPCNVKRIVLYLLIRTSYRTSSRKEKGSTAHGIILHCFGKEMLNKTKGSNVGGSSFLDDLSKSMTRTLTTSKKIYSMRTLYRLKKESKNKNKLSTITEQSIDIYIYIIISK